VSITLYPHQDQFIRDLRQAMTTADSVLGQAMTGFGKTCVASAIAQSAVSKGKRVIFTVHRGNLMDQTAGTFREFEIPHGFIVAGTRYEDQHQVAVASIATLTRRLAVIPAPDLLVIDEAHLALAATWAKVINFYRERGTKILAFTATPRRLDGRPLSDLFDRLVLGPSPRWLIDNGFLSDYRAFCPSEVDLSGVKMKLGDFDHTALEAAVNKPALTGDAARHYLKLANGTRALAYCVSIRHSENVAAHFNEQGIPAAHIDGGTPREGQRRIIRAFADGEIMVLCNVDLLTTGFDLSAQAGREVPVETIIGLRPTASLALHLQMLGRGLRRKPNPAIFLDHAGNLKRHGFPDDGFEWTLAGQPKREKRDGETDAVTRHCPNCHALHRPAPTCPECGFEYPAQARHVAQVDGELVEIKAEDRRLRARQEQAACRSLADLKALAAARGYHPAWADKVWSARSSHQRVVGRQWR
jgi:superfamily II DNA or RNA helicase